MSSGPQNLAALLQGLNQNALLKYRPHAKQAEFHRLGIDHRERALLAGNRLGKTTCATNEGTYHALGDYPDWWEGKRFHHPTTGWVANATFEVSRDVNQAKFLGDGGPDSFGTGSIPKSRIVKWTTLRSSVADCVDTLYVRHSSGGVSTIKFKAYVQGIQSFTGAAVDWMHMDEIVPDAIYSEALRRLQDTRGVMMLTVTPTSGLYGAVKHFYPAPDANSRALVLLSIEESGLFTPEEIAEEESRIPPHERDCRLRGVPAMGTGLIFPVPDSDIVCDAFEGGIPTGWPQIVGLDFGYNHPTAATRLAYDRDNDTVYVTAEYRKREETPVIHAAAIRAWGDWLPVAWPHDGVHHDKGSGISLKQTYTKLGLKMLHEYATFHDGGYGVETGLLDMYDRMRTGRWKVMRHCQQWLAEKAQYHRKMNQETGRVQIWKVDDDLISASRYGLMMLRFARAEFTESKRYKASQVNRIEWSPLAI